MTEYTMIDEGHYLLEGLRQYLSVCNTIMVCNKERFPFAQIWRAMEERLTGQVIKFVVMEHEQEGQQWAVFSSGKIRRLEGPPRRCDCPSVMTKKVALPYLEAVIDDPSRYIANPALIDWDWVPSVSPKRGPPRHH